MKKYITTMIAVMVMLLLFTMPGYAFFDDESINKNNKGVIVDEGAVDMSNSIGDVKSVVKNVGNVKNSGNSVIEEGAVTIEEGAVKSVVKNSGNSTVKNVGNVRNSGNSEQDQHQKQKQQQGQAQTAHNEGVTQETTINDGDTTQTIGDTTQTNEGNIQVVVIENPDEIKVNSQLNPMAGQQVDTLEYHGDTREDHKYQDEILEFLLRTDNLKPFVVKKKGIFTRKSSHSASKSVTTTEYPATGVVYVFRDEAELNEYVKSYKIVGYTDTFSKGKATLMDCFDQSVIDAGKQGGNILVILDINYMEGIKSTTVGLGGSGASGFMSGSDRSSVYGAAVGYASSSAVPNTNPFIHCMILYSAELALLNK